MKTLPLLGRVSAVTVLSLSLAACGLFKAPDKGPDTVRTWQDEVIYFAMTDRFANGNPANDNGPNRNAGDRADRSNPLGWHGGDFAGLKAKIEEGYFKRMGFTALWITPVVLQVPAIPVGDGPNKGKSFAGYHGYWAEDFFKTDPHLGSLEEYQSLIDTAHKNGLKVIQDVVLNHAGYDATLTKTHPDWFHTQAECDASSNPTTDCPLAGLPDFKQDLPAVTTYLNDFIRYWRTNTAIDGLRIDTMKHVPDSYWKQFFAPGGAGDAGKIWSVGEVFDGNPAYLAHFMDDLGSPSVFDFALYYAVSQQMSSAGGNLDRMADVFAQDGVYQDASRLTTFVDNHDVKRFVSEVTGKGGTPAQAAERLDMALSTVYFSRGTPSVWQGTEYAQPGQGDPYNFPLGEGNREDMDFSKLANSALDERLGALAAARAKYRALTHGAQQELWRPNGGPGILAYRRVISNVAGTAGQPVVFVVNNGDTATELSTLSGGGIPLLGTFGGGALTEITGHASNLSVSGGKLVGTVPPRSVLAVTGAAGGGAGGTVNPSLPEVAALAARPGDSAVELTWTPSSDAGVSGYRVYARTGDGTERLLNFAPLPKDTGKYLARGVTNDVATTFRVVTVDTTGAESTGATVRATPSSKNTVKVTFTVDARSQGNGPVELRRFDTGSQLELPMTQESRGIWKTTADLPLFRQIEFKFGNDGSGAKNSGYEGPDQGNRRYVVGADGNSYSGTYDFIEVPVPPVIEGKVTGAGGPLSGALVEAGSANPKLNYALTFADGGYTLFAPAGAQTLKASAAGFTDATRQATSPGTGADLTLTREVTNAKYTIDGVLSDWKTLKVSVQSPMKGGFDADNNFLTLLADSDATYLYLAYTYRVLGNSAIVYLDTGAGGALKADNFEAWKRAVTFGGGMGGVDAFVARYENQAAQLRRVSSDTATPEVLPADYRYAASGTLPAQTVELAIPWTALGLTGAPAGGVNIVGGIFGGDGYGAGDIVPDANSTPSGANTIGTDSEQRRATFTAPVNVK
ncbi:alpha-amylase family glycosyl hydrolase [Deinococcus radiopugnans]|uniref:Alpha-amylase n=1 Tax=Deinococcus radiopugnans ATCC 19172 TaxID=585398 RepID=A0A5C4YAL0_9DEIO|nr:alpha-amylase family glycosyl hydrolase [Deinococcus radiopugnans]MBB6015722.1 glycosidase [Deinococcus radiopugnans ATCC 19172]TNM72591.1 alpha-amylase [Deinococcus radiopugnans ATCC 19172]